MRLYDNFRGFDGLGDPVIDPTTGAVSPLMNSGDPVTNTGWLQGLYFHPCDTYFMSGSGAFSLAPFDTQRVVYALIVGQGDSRLTSIMDLRKNANFVRNAFRSQFSMLAEATATVRYLSATEAEVKVTAQIKGPQDARAIRAEFYDYHQALIHAMDLFDDGQHDNGLANDQIWGHRWQTATTTEAYYLNLNIIDANSKTHEFRHAADNITLSASGPIVTSLNVAADHINSDGKLNPGENARLTLAVTNNFSHELGALNVQITTDDPFARIEPQHFFFKNLLPGVSKELSYHRDSSGTYFVLDLAANLPDTHTLFVDATLIDNQHHIWRQRGCAGLKTEPLKYVPNRVIPAHVSGYSDARFVVSVIDPKALTGHTYLITVTDAINPAGEQGFNLIDQNLGTILLQNQAVPDRYAYNIPITDGFKIIEAYLPKGGIVASFEQAAGGNPNYPFNELSKAITYRNAPVEAFQPVEMVFTNTIDSSGILGPPLGQGAFQYNFFPSNGPHGFYRSAFEIYRLENGQRAGRLNACFEESWPWLPNYNLTWTPGEFLYIMATEYDSTGQYYFQPTSQPKSEVLYVVSFSFVSKTSVVDAGDRCFMDREFRATREDVWSFLPTRADEERGNVPAAFRLYQNYPNPFNSMTTICFAIRETTPISLKIFNVMGQAVSELIDQEYAPGNYLVRWDGRDRSGHAVASGLYFVRLQGKDNSAVIKMMLLR